MDTIEHCNSLLEEFYDSSKELKRTYSYTNSDQVQRWLANASPEKNKVLEKYGYKPKRNSTCPCGSKKKYKNCCYEADKQL